MEHSPLVAFMKDARGRYVYINARMEEAFGIAADRIPGIPTPTGCLSKLHPLFGRTIAPSWRQGRRWK